MKRNHCLGLLLVSMLCVSSCRFVTPSGTEVGALNKSGVFNEGAPAWAKLPPGQNNMLPKNAGLVPQTFTVPESVSMSSAANASSSTSAEIGRGIDESKKSLNQDINEKRKVLNEYDAGDKSPIAKLEKECPGSEAMLVDALKTEQAQSRIKKYLILTKKCPSNSDIWVWLARDYQALGRISNSKRCAQAALALDANNREAKELLIELDKED